MSAKIKSWKDSASLIALVRNRIVNKDINVTPPYNYQVLVQKRSGTSSFLRDSLVFPGGAYDESDSVSRWLEHFKSFGFTDKNFDEFKLSNRNLPQIFHGIENSAKRNISLRISAIRETFEEMGILICRNRNIPTSKIPWASYISNFDVGSWQKKVHNNPQEFLNLCLHLDCYPDIWSLFLWSNWLTPVDIVSHRFDTVFFLTGFESNPPVHIESQEVSEYKWCDPKELLDGYRQKSLVLPPPQFYEISRLSNQKDIDRLLTFAAARCKLGCELHFPVKQAAEDGIVIALPGDDFYPENPNPMEKNVLFSGSKSLEELQNESTTLHRMEIPKKDKLLRLRVKNFVPNNSHISPAMETIPKLQSSL